MVMEDVCMYNIQVKKQLNAYNIKNIYNGSQTMGKVGQKLASILHFWVYPNFSTRGNKSREDAESEYNPL